MYLVKRSKRIGMEENKMMNYIQKVIQNMPTGWLSITTHRLDIYEESLAKTQFLDEFEKLYNQNDASEKALSSLPTAYDYIRLGHPLSCVLEWAVAKKHKLRSENVISFSSNTMPLLAILRKNGLENKKTQIVYTDEFPMHFDAEMVKSVYGYQFEIKKVESLNELSDFNGSTVLVSYKDTLGDEGEIISLAKIDFLVTIHPNLGSVLLVIGEQNERYISEIQHVRRRETIAMTPSNSLIAIKSLIENAPINPHQSNRSEDKQQVLNEIKKITGSNTKALVASSGLSIQYAIMMGLVQDALENHPGKAIKFIVPPNCYGGTNDQARRVAQALENVEIVDLLVDGDNDMVRSIDHVLNHLANDHAVPYIIAEIPTNPRVEVPDLEQLKAVLTKERKTAAGETAIDPVFILDQTFCPNALFLGEGEILSSVRTISFASGSKFPSGGLCTAGYCVGNTKTVDLIEKIEKQLLLCDNEAKSQQYEILASQLPSMNQRIKAAYQVTREFVNFIHEVLPTAKINFVSEELARQDFTPSVFSLDLPTKGKTDAEKEEYKRALNLKLIHLMITEIPHESKFCVSYGQLKGSYWTIPATSTQGTTKEGDKDYIVRVALSGNMDLELHKKVFLDFVKSI